MTGLSLKNIVQGVRFSLALCSYVLYVIPMSNTPSSIDALIDQWPTITEFAAEVGCGYEAARQMRRRKSIAPEHWARVVKASNDRGIDGVSFEWLAEQRLATAEAAE